MFSICRSNQTCGGLACLVVILLGIVACSREPATAPSAPMVEAQPSASAAPAADVLESAITAGGMQATYRATFADKQLRHIGETRAANGSEGEYEFQGARLMKYVGGPLSGTGPIEIQFDLQGAVTMSRAPSGEVSPEEISAIRTRAQLLRSHALAQRATRTHQTR
jgi:hypothetical protein